MKKEYRIVHVSRPGYFVCFDTEAAARRSLNDGSLLQSRPAGTQGDDSTWMNEPTEADLAVVVSGDEPMRKEEFGLIAEAQR